MVNDFISYIETSTVGYKTTMVRCVLRNGFEIIETSACVDAQNYDQKLGEEICMKKIKDKIWYLLGFLLDMKQLTVQFIDEEAIFPCMEDMTKKWRRIFMMMGAKFEWYCVEVKELDGRSKPAGGVYVTGKCKERLQGGLYCI